MNVSKDKNYNYSTIKKFEILLSNTKIKSESDKPLAKPGPAAPQK